MYIYIYYYYYYILYNIILLQSLFFSSGKKSKGGLGFSKTSLETAMNHLIENYYLNAENVTMKQAIGIPNQFYILMKNNTFIL